MLEYANYIIRLAMAAWDTPMSILAAVPTDLQLVKNFISTSTRRLINLGDEDLAVLVATGNVLIGMDSAIWGVIAFQPEARPVSLPAQAPDRIYLRAAAFGRAVSPSEGMHELVDAYCARESGLPRLVIAYGGEPWYDRALMAANLVLREQVYFYALERLGQQVARWPRLSGPAALQLAFPEDMARLAQLDAQTFDEVWHMSEWDLGQLLMHGRIELAFLQGELVGYAATTYNQDVAQIARLAVRPDVQRAGIGRQLLLASLHTAEDMGCTAVILNTQAHNEHAQHLYRSVGFRQTGEHFGVFTRLATAYAPLSRSTA